MAGNQASEISSPEGADEPWERTPNRVIAPSIDIVENEPPSVDIRERSQHRG
jgi:hypothetical protein